MIEGTYLEGGKSSAIETCGGIEGGELIPLKTGSQNRKEGGKKKIKHSFPKKRKKGGGGRSVLDMSEKGEKGKRRIF